MELDLRNITEKLITEMLLEAENLKQQAEGVRKLYIRIAEEGEKANGPGQQDSVDGTTSGNKE